MADAMYVYTYVTLSHLRSKEITGILSHVYLIPGLQLNVNWYTFGCSLGKWCTSNMHFENEVFDGD